jgi:hypothetical protein
MSANEVWVFLELSPEVLQEVFAHALVVILHDYFFPSFNLLFYALINY